MNNLGDMIAGAFEKVKGIVDSNSCVGTSIVTADGTTLIPITKISIGMGAGGHDANPDGKMSFSGGTGAGITMSPVAFIVISGGNTRVVYVNQGEKVNTVDRILDMVPPTVDKITSFIDSRKAKKESEEEPDFEVEYYTE